MRHLPATTVFLALVAGCNQTPARQSQTFAAGEKATVDHLTYTVVDSEIQPRLGDDASARFPQTRFVIVQLAVSNGGSATATVPGLTLVDDSGKTYPELADGTGVAHWLGVMRRVAPAATERGAVLFDAPAGHYKLKLTDDAGEGDVYIDMPLTFVHEQMNDAAAPALGTLEPSAGQPSAAGAKKK